MKSEENAQKTVVSCPICHKQVVWDAEHKFKPFCCERCKLIDLGEWAAEEKKIPGEPAYFGSETDYDS